MQRRRRCAHGIFPGTAADKSQTRKNIPIDAWRCTVSKDLDFHRRQSEGPVYTTTTTERRMERGSETGGD